MTTEISRGDIDRVSVETEVLVPWYSWRCGEIEDDVKDWQNEALNDSRSS